MKFFLVTTDHLKDRIWFKDDEDFSIAMSCVAIVAFSLKINVLAFILMSNHVHFVLQCEPGEAKAFIDRFKMQYGIWYHRKYNHNEFLRRVKVDITEVGLLDGGLQRAIAYVQMNCVAANICPYCNMYQWGTGNCFFNPQPPKYSLLGELSIRARHRLLRSRVQLPSDYKVIDSSYILPQSFVPVQFVESLFRTPSRYLYFLGNSSKARKHLEKDVAPSFRDQIVVAAIQDLCYSLFRAKGITELTDEQRGELLRQIRRRFSTDLSQLCRATGLSYDKAARMIEDF